VGDSEKKEKESAAAINFTNFEGTIGEFYSCLEDNKRTDIKEGIIEKFREMKKSNRLISTNNLVNETLSNFGIEFTGKIALSM
jgi:F0F1-type ATP synthase delta subunit